MKFTVVKIIKDVRIKYLFVMFCSMQRKESVRKLIECVFKNYEFRRGKN